MGVLSKVSAVPGGKPFEPFGKDSICSEGGSTGRRTDWPCHINIAEKVKLLRPSVQLPAGIHGCAVYTDFRRDGKAKRRESHRPGTCGDLTQQAPAVSLGSTFGDFQHSGAPMTAAFTFPGQGSQAVGMGKALADAFPAARAVFDEVDAALGEKLTAIIWDGPAETLQLTENAQPALMAVSLATLRVLGTEAGFSVERDAAFVAGHSLGEYSALAAAGSLSISDSARLLRSRGLALQEAVPVGVGAMAALLG